ncbi:class I SAM-dependent methyltransferase [Mycobacterium haemophilum]|uniref:SAM-dependent methyltransferase n=1 Tax=Mycobacterium haemophilum TaxID=29311 RepID=A0A0I9VG36_9MYCO|nr:methyltransferase domain-containing protein [Mycobacterium haemophilum]KLO32517.1 SAM-dependent methyltransferase [Mycobacterium haemophilum]KLO36778.1 SAM-dependent methyltransferase [Mycobacterium haemophilum]KLO42797.1 SAM-dependent methyltransferase [Mycobacterium haemophilum]KLO55829.1 SAM-dependent methyltransferase [Mycobacterium haemophilum]
MTGELMDWEAVYREHGVFVGRLAWNIGEAQPEIAALIRAGKIRSDVLDAGCGVAELSLALAAHGHTVVGIDLSGSAIALAERAAKDRGLGTATFVQDDITSFTGYDDRFNTVIDSTLFHSLPVEARDSYIRAVYRAAAPGASYYVLVFAASAFPVDIELPRGTPGTIPKLVTEEELREAVSQYWEIDEIRPASIHANLADIFSLIPGISLDNYEFDEKRRLKIPSFLLTAHKAG